MKIDSIAIQLQILQEYEDIKIQVRNLPGLSIRHPIFSQVFEQIDFYHYLLIQEHGQLLADEIMTHIALCGCIKPLQRNTSNIVSHAFRQLTHVNL